MASVFDVAQYILSEHGRMSTLKLQKLVFYCQAWHLVWDDEPLFNEAIEAWKDGPVVRALWESHRGEFVVSRVRRGDAKELSENERESIDAVLTAYGPYDGNSLRQMTHDEAPWVEARGDIPDGEPCFNEIPLESIKRYYGSL